MKRKITALLLMLCCLIVGLLTPRLLCTIQDTRTEGSLIPLTSSSHYAYQGTLLNRVLAYSAHLNHSPAVESRTIDCAAVPEELWSKLASFLPLSADYTSAHSSALWLLPRQYRAEYHFLQIDYSSGGITLRAVIDEETQLPVRVELHTSSQVMTDFSEEYSLWSILGSYAALLDLGEISGDGAVTVSTVLRSETDSLRGAPFAVTVSILPSAGTLILKLEGIPST